MDDKREELLGKLALFAFNRAQKRFLTRDVGLAERRGERLGLFLYRIDRKHRERAALNLKLAFPDWSEERCREVGKDVFRHWGRVMGDFLRSPVRGQDEVIASIEAEGLDHWEAARSEDRGIIAMTGHLGNFERFGHWCTAQGRPLTVVARDANQGPVQAQVAAIRAASGVEVLSRGDSARAIIAKLRKHELIGILPDQSAAESFPQFFGHPCGTVLGPAVLGIRTKAILMPAFCVRTGVGQYRVIVKPPIPIEGREKDPVSIMADFNSVLESVIRDYPDQYLWMHDRWKSARKRGLV